MVFSSGTTLIKMRTEMNREQTGSKINQLYLSIRMELMTTPRLKKTREKMQNTKRKALPPQQVCQNMQEHPLHVLVVVTVAMVCFLTLTGGMSVGMSVSVSMTM